MDQNQKRWAVFMIRLFLGGIFFIAGLSKIFFMGVPGFVGYVQEQFAGTFLPELFINGFGYTLPYVEFVLGIVLIVGLFRQFSFIVAGFLAMVLAHGQFLIEEHATAAHNGIYFLIAIAGLLLLTRPCFALDSFRSGPTSTVD